MNQARMLFAAVLFATAAVAASPQENPQRVLGLEGAPNFRDVGGYATRSGKHVRWGVVYRSNALGKLTPADAARVDKLDIAAVIDLRTEEERARSPSIWIRQPANRYESPKPTLAPVMSTILQDARTAAGARAGLTAFYAEMPDTYKDEYSAMFHRIAAGDLPMLIHCTAGKDRTGVAVAILLRSVGVPRAMVVADYELTDTLVPAPVMAKQAAVPVGASAQGALAQLPEESRIALWQSNPQYLNAALDSIDREYGSVDAYVSQGLGLSMSEMKSLRQAITH